MAMVLTFPVLLAIYELLSELHSLSTSYLPPCCPLPHRPLPTPPCPPSPLPHRLQTAGSLKLGSSLLMEVVPGRPKERYEDLDEVAARFVEPLQANLAKLTAHRKWKGLAWEKAQVGGWVGGWGWSCGWQAALCDPWSCPLPALFLTLQLPKKDSPCPRRCAAEHPGVCLAPHPWCSQRGWPWQMPWQMMHWSWSPPAATCWRQSTEQGAVDISSSSSGGWRMVPAAGPSPAPPCQERQKRQPRKKL